MSDSKLMSKLDSAIASARQRVLLGAALSILSLGVVGFYLRHAYHEFTSVTPEFLSNYAAAEVLVALPKATPEIRKRVIDFAPTALDQAQAKLLEVPDHFAGELLNRLTAEAEQFSRTAEAELVSAVRTGLLRLRDELPEGKTDTEKLARFVDALAEVYAAETSRLLEQVHDVYGHAGGDALAYLELLAEGRDLDAKQALQREALVTFLTLASRAKSAAADEP